MAGAGQATQDAVRTLATVLAVVLVVLPVGWLLLRWLPWRLGWAREARRRATGCSPATPDLELLAARAMATAPAPRLAGPARRAPARAGGPATRRRSGRWPAWSSPAGLRLPDPDTVERDRGPTTLRSVDGPQPGS